VFNDLSKRVRAIKPSPTLAVSNLARQLRAQGGDDLHYDVDVANLLLEEVGVALVPGSAFGAEGYMRISFATSMENLQKAVARIRQVFEG
jgi:aspartate/methionine/tyrosine aminotransferase